MNTKARCKGWARPSEQANVKRKVRWVRGQALRQLAQVIARNVGLMHVIDDVWMRDHAAGVMR